MLAIWNTERSLPQERVSRKLGLFKLHMLFGPSLLLSEIPAGAEGSDKSPVFAFPLFQPGRAKTDPKLILKSSEERKEICFYHCKIWRGICTAWSEEPAGQGRDVLGERDLNVFLSNPE